MTTPEEAKSEVEAASEQSTQACEEWLNTLPEGIILTDVERALMRMAWMASKAHGMEEELKLIKED